VTLFQSSIERSHNTGLIVDIKSWTLNIKLNFLLLQEVEIDTESIFLYPPEKPSKVVIDIPLHLVFLCFHSNEILKILSAILLEERIVFISSSYALLTTIMQVSIFTLFVRFNSPLGRCIIQWSSKSRIFMTANILWLNYVMGLSSVWRHNDICAITFILVDRSFLILNAMVYGLE